MLDFLSMPKQELEHTYAELLERYRRFQEQKLNLNMARGKPSGDQLELSSEMLDLVSSSSALYSESGEDCRNYGVPLGLTEMRRLMADLMEVPADHVIIGGNSSLNMMFDAVACGMTHGFSGCAPWGRQKNVKFLCPSPGYDRHFAITEYFGFDLIIVPMTPDGPDMDAVEKLVQDPSVKGIWCVPKYQNPTGITFSDETVRRFAGLKPAAKDFRIFWDNAYCVHDLTETPDSLLNLWKECERRGNPNLAFFFSSTSKITYPGAGIAAMAAGSSDFEALKKRYSYQTISADKLNQLRHARFLKDLDGVRAHMARHRALLAPKFKTVLNKLETELAGKGVASWTEPNGGYFISVDVLEGCAKRVVALCAEAGVKLTGAGATYPYGRDPRDSNIRVAPTFPPVEELRQAIDLFCICVQLAAAEKLLKT
ncbi:aminotransferase class I/II-fold pyridoxal phosphate-dependent enzyme [Caproiciproducens sp. NJN-50]|uniref:aminotransferase class I/II-fold pyridoxal phosphate-dependent enzyme n=1 Tax=Acutalibacteraceae TaxID=3082771 RepID=UPI003FA4AB04